MGSTTGYKGNCQQPYVREEVIEEQIGALLENFNITDEIQELVLQDLRESMQDKINYHNSCIDQIERQMKVLQNRIDQTYLDKLDGKINEDFWKRQTDKWLLEKESLMLSRASHQKADINYLKNATIILELAKNACQLFKNGKKAKKRELASILFLNCVMQDGMLDLELRLPYDKILVSGKTGNWRPLGDIFRNQELEFSYSLSIIKGVFSSLNIPLLH